LFVSFCNFWFIDFNTLPPSSLGPCSLCVLGALLMRTAGTADLALRMAALLTNLYWVLVFPSTQQTFTNKTNLHNWFHLCPNVLVLHVGYVLPPRPQTSFDGEAPFYKISLPYAKAVSLLPSLGSLPLGTLLLWISLVVIAIYLPFRCYREPSSDGTGISSFTAPAVMACPTDPGQLCSSYTPYRPALHLHNHHVACLHCRLLDMSPIRTRFQPWRPVPSVLIGGAKLFLSCSRRLDNVSRLTLRFACPDVIHEIWNLLYHVSSVLVFNFCPGLPSCSCLLAAVSFVALRLF
jgi:hypothetical protein